MCPRALSEIQARWWKEVAVLIVLKTSSLIDVILSADSVLLCKTESSEGSMHFAKNYFTPFSGFQLPCSLRTTTICPT